MSVPASLAEHVWQEDGELRFSALGRSRVRLARGGAVVLLLGVASLAALVEPVLGLAGLAVASVPLGLMVTHPRQGPRIGDGWMHVDGHRVEDIQEPVEIRGAPGGPQSLSVGPVLLCSVSPLGEDAFGVSVAEVGQLAADVARRLGTRVSDLRDSEVARWETDAGFRTGVRLQEELAFCEARWPTHYATAFVEPPGTHDHVGVVYRIGDQQLAIDGMRVGDELLATVDDVVVLMHGHQVELVVRWGIERRVLLEVHPRWMAHVRFVARALERAVERARPHGSQADVPEAIRSLDSART